MKRLTFLLVLLASLRILHSSFSAQPNILLIYADDLNCEIGCYGNALVKSPNLDKLAARGVRFERAFCQYPLCNPSRTSMMTGLRPETLGQTAMGNSKDEVKLPAGASTLGAWLRGHGYFTAKAGKIFHGEKYTDSWDEALAFADSEAGGGVKSKAKSAAFFAMPPKTKLVNGVEKKLGEALVSRVLPGGDEQTNDGKVARDGVKLLARAAQSGKPFFVAIGFHAPHLPLDAPEKYFDLYDPAKIPLPDEPLELLKDTPSTALNSSGSTERPLTREERQKATAAYYASVSFLDVQVGVVLDALEEQKLADNTLVVFVSDHGFHLGDHGGLWSKTTLFDAAARVPFIFAGPGVAAHGQASPRVVELVDLFPTLMAVCALPAPEKLQGRSLAPFFQDPQAASDRPARTVVINHERVSGASIRTERYTFTEWAGGQRGIELYDRSTDPQEMRNLAADPAHSDALRQMQRLLRSLPTR